MYHQDISLENDMFTRIYPLASPIVKLNLLKSLTQTGLYLVKSQSTRPCQPVLRKVKFVKKSGENLNSIDNNLYFTALNLTVFFSNEKSRNKYQNIPINHPSLKLPLLAANDDAIDG